MLIKFKPETCPEAEGGLINTEHIAFIDTNVPKDKDGEHFFIVTDVTDPDDNENIAFLCNFPNQKAKEDAIKMLASAMKGIQEI